MQGKTVIVTGAARRVGAAIARRLHGAGANLVLHYRASAEAARALQAELCRSRPGSAALVAADLLDLDALPGIVETALSAFGRLDALVNNASSFYATPVGEIGERAWDDLIGSNLKAPLFLAQAARAALTQARGCIVNIIDIHAERPLKNYAVYTAAKGGLASLTRALALDLSPQVRVNGVAPGAILWPESGEWQHAAERENIIRKTLLQRVGEPDDIAKTVQFLIADAPYITGQIINVDGGRSIYL